MPNYVHTLGGLGLFLIGMAVMRDGLKGLVDRTVTKWMSSFTRTTPLAALTGFMVTVLLQSSTAVSVMAVGFVAAGLLTFPRALGVILGANVGSTMTGWIVALIGVKFELQSITLPLIFLGALLRLFGRPRIASWGFALAGFGLVFSGVAMLQEGMQGLDRLITPQTFPGDTWRGRFLLLLVGLGVTLITHSSAAGVALAVSAIHLGSISLSQGTALVIGMDIGTTATAALATVGASVNARRTGFAHVFFNLLTGAGAFFILPLYVGGLRRLAPQWTAANPELALVGFHTAFNLLGVAMMLPYANAFSRVIERLIPQNNELLFRLEPTLLGQPRLALANVRLTLEHIAARCAEVCRKLLTVNQLDAVMGELIACQTALDETRLYLERIPRSSVEMDTWSSHVNCLHVVDHLGRLLARVQKANRVHAVRSSEGLKKPREELARILGMDWRAAEDLAKLAEALKSYSTSLDDKVSAYRRRTVEQAALGKVPLDDAWSLLDGYRWLRRVSFHFYRILEHLRAADSGQVAPLPPGNGMAEESPDAD